MPKHRGGMCSGAAVFIGLIFNRYQKKQKPACPGGFTSLRNPVYRVVNEGLHTSQMSSPKECRHLTLLSSTGIADKNFSIYQQIRSRNSGRIEISQQSSFRLSLTAIKGFFMSNLCCRGQMFNRAFLIFLVCVYGAHMKGVHVIRSYIGAFSTFKM